MAASDFRNEASAAYEARKELGPEYEHAVLDSFADRAAESINERVDARLAELGVRGPRPEGPEPVGKRREGAGSLAFPAFSLTLGVVSTIVMGADEADPAFALVMWLAIAAINVVYARRRRSP